MTIYVKQFDLLQMVYQDKPDVDLISPAHSAFEPWRWDERHWTDERLENNYKVIGTAFDQDIKNLSSEYWQPGVATLRDLEVYEAVTSQEGQTEKWTVNMDSGYYFQSHVLRHIFSDSARTQYMHETYAPSGVDSVSSLELDILPMQGSPIAIQNWIRDGNDQHRVYTQLQQRNKFTGVIDNETGLFVDTEDDEGNILWANVSQSRQEFVIKYSGDPAVATLYCNRDYTFEVGINKEDPTIPGLEDYVYWYDLLSDRDDQPTQVFYTQYFPISATGFVLYYATGSTVEAVVPTSIDYDRGEIIIEDTGHEGHTLYAGYKVILEVEYEPDADHDLTLVPTGINMDPLASPLNRGFIYISETELRAYGIQLDILGLPQIGVELFGPLNIGGEFCTLRAVVTSNSGQPVPGVAVTFSFATDRGEINQGTINGAESVIAITGSYGEAYATYVTPYSADVLSGISTHEDGSFESQNLLSIPSEMLVNLTELADLYVYAIYHVPDADVEGGGPGSYDPVTGMGGVRVILYRWDDGSYNYLTTDGDYTVYEHLATTPGAIMPIHPNNISGGKLGFEHAIPWTDPDAEGYTVPVAYWICGVSLVKFKAECISYITDTTITSNVISLKAQLPDNRRGIKTIEGIMQKKIPIGYRFLAPNSTDIVATSLDGATFLRLRGETGSELGHDFIVDLS